MSRPNTSASRKTARTSPSTIVTEPASLRILHLTDPHLFADKAGHLRGTETYRSLCRVLDRYTADDWQADLVFATGDLIQDDKAEAYGHFRELLTPLGLPTACLPGNHDTRALMQKALSSAPFSYCPSVDRDNWRLICVDSCVAGKAAGAVSDSELHRLQQEIEATAAEHIAVFLHHPPVKLNSTWLDTVGLDNAADFFDVLRSSAKVRAAVFGHAHQAYDAMHGAIRVIGTPSTCRQFKPNSHDFTLDDRPPAYRQLTLMPDGDIGSNLIWAS